LAAATAAWPRFSPPERDSQGRQPANDDARTTRRERRVRAGALIRFFGAAALVLAACPAVAADFPGVAPAPRGGTPVYDWSGAYTGVNLGYLWSAIGNLGTKPRGIAGGIQAGYNWQVGRLVFGGESDLQLTGAEDTFAAYKFSNPWFGTLRGRMGYAFDNVLLYGTAGLAYGGGRLEIAGLSESRTHLGWTAGGGVEIGLTPRWSAKAEYLFTSLRDKTYVLSGVSNGIDSQLVRAGLNFRF
jgi:outer membrane immunogenic protein